MSGVHLAIFGALGALLLCVVTIDIAERRIPDGANIALAFLGFARSLYAAPTIATVLAAAGGVALTATVIVGATRVANHLDRSAMGWGDVKFLLAASFWVGFAGSVMVFLIAGTVTLIWVLAVAPWQGFDLRRTVPFGPMLALGLIFVLASTGIGQRL